MESMGTLPPRMRPHAARSWRGSMLLVGLGCSMRVRCRRRAVRCIQFSLCCIGLTGFAAGARLRAPRGCGSLWIPHRKCRSDSGRRINWGGSMATVAAPRVYKNFIGGEWVEPRGQAAAYDNRNPANTDELVGMFCSSGQADIDAAVDAA